MELSEEMLEDVEAVQEKIELLENKIDLLFSPKFNYSNVRPECDPNFDKKLEKRKEDAGYDVWCSFKENQTVEEINNSNTYMNRNSKGEFMIKIEQFTSGIVPLGIATAIGSDFALSLKHERSSVGSKGLFVNAGLIDSGYRNGWNIVITPIAGDLIITTQVDETKIIKDPRSGKTLIYYPYTKAIGQIVVIHNIDSKAEEIPYESLLKITSERGIDGFGSTN